MPPIQWIEQPTGALVAAGSLWPNNGIYTFKQNETCVLVFHNNGIYTFKQNEIYFLVFHNKDLGNL
jgi:hypothetical protein